jgi:hypothetical protein
MFRPLQSAPQPEALPAYNAPPSQLPGDWRAATRNIEEEPEYVLNGRIPKH